MTLRGGGSETLSQEDGLVVDHRLLDEMFDTRLNNSDSM